MLLGSMSMKAMVLKALILDKIHINFNVKYSWNSKIVSI